MKNIIVIYLKKKTILIINNDLVASHSYRISKRLFFSIILRKFKIQRCVLRNVSPKNHTVRIPTAPLAYRINL